MRNHQVCSGCNGRGEIIYDEHLSVVKITCGLCSGKGYYEVKQAIAEARPCPHCEGCGSIRRDSHTLGTCDICLGTGVARAHTIRVKHT